MSLLIGIILAVALVKTLGNEDFFEKLDRSVNCDDVTQEDLQKYEQIFVQRRALSQWEPSKSMVRLIGIILSHQANTFDDHLFATISGARKNHMNELIRVQRDQSSAIFYEYYQRGWNPQVFTWPTLPNGDYIQQHFHTIKTDPNFPVWSSSILAGISYARDLVPNAHLGHHFIRLERVEHAFHFYALNKCIGALPHQFTQIIEYGGGTGDYEAFLREMNFQGLHFIIDVPPMLFLQNYFLKYSGWPSYFGSNLTSLNGRRTILESSLKLDKFTSHISPKLIRNTLFFATSSDIDLPDSDLFAKYGVIMILLTRNSTTVSTASSSLSESSNTSFGYGSDVGNSTNVLKIAEEWSSILSSLYSICVWSVPARTDGAHYFIARLKTMGSTTCSEAAGCNKNTRVLGSC